MHPLKHLSIGAAATLGIALATDSASAASFFTSGQACEYSSTFQQAGGDHWRDDKGTANMSTTSGANLYCPFRYPGVNTTIQNVHVWFTDMNGTTGFNTNVMCSIAVYMNDPNAPGQLLSYTSPYRYGCSANNGLGGCSSDPGAFSGAGLIVISDPFITNTPLTAASLSAYCWLPRATGTARTNFSEIRSYGLNAT